MFCVVLITSCVVLVSAHHGGVGYDQRICLGHIDSNILLGLMRAEASVSRCARMPATVTEPVKLKVSKSNQAEAFVFVSCLKSTLDAISYSV